MAFMGSRSNSSYKRGSWSDLQNTWNTLNSDLQNKIRNMVAQEGGNANDSHTILNKLSAIESSVAGSGDIKTGINNAAQSAGVTGAQYVSPEEQQKQAEFENFLTGENQKWADLINQTKTEQAGRLTDLSALLKKQQTETFNAEAPDIQEQLNAQGLLRSSALGEAYAKEKSRLSQLSENMLTQQSLTDQDVIQQLRQGQFGGELDWRNALKQREFSLEDWTREADLAREIANMQINAQNTQAKYQLIGAGIQGLGTAAGGWLGRK